MVAFRFSALALVALRILPAFAQLAEDVKAPDGQDIPVTSPKLNIGISTSFPSSEIFGVKLVNGKPTEALLSVKNNEVQDVSVAFVGGSLWAPDSRTNGETSVNVRNLTSTRYNVRIPAGEADSISYNFATELHPQDLRLNLVAVITSAEGVVYTVNAYNETVSVVEPDASLFDPQLIFLYILLAAGFGGACYFIYTTWVATLFPQQAKKPARKPLPAKKTEADAAAGPDVAVATGAFDASWIPDHHINRPEARRLKSGGGANTSRSKSRGA